MENFVISIGAAHPESGKEGVNCVIEDCIAEAPGLNAAHNSSVFTTLTGETPKDGLMGWHRAYSIRHCWYDGTLVDRPVPIGSITISGGVATVTTRVPHHRSNGDQVVIAGAVENGSTRSAYNGTYPISGVSPSQPLQFTYNPVGYDGLSVPTTNPTGEMWVDRSSSHPIPIQSLIKDPDPNNSTGTTAILTTHGPHNRKLGQHVRVIARISPLAGGGAFYGWFPIIEISSPQVLKYRMAAAPTALSVQAVLGVLNLGFAVDSGSEAVAEGNRTFNSGVAGPYHDTWGTKDFVARNNYFSDCFRGPYQNLSLTSELKVGSSITYQNISGQWVATFTTHLPHGLQINDTVKIRGAVTFVTGVGYTYTNAYNGDSFQVLSSPAPTATSFSYLLASDPGMNAAGSPIFFKTTAPDPVKNGSVANPQNLDAVFDSSPNAHEFEIDDLVSVFGVAVNGSIDNPFNGVAIVTAKTATTFTYKLVSAPSGSPGGSPCCAKAVATPLIADGTTATYRTVFPHGFAAGQGVWLRDTDPDPLISGPLLGFLQIETVSSPTAFIFIPSSISYDNGRPGSLFAAIWQVGFHVVENNIIELNQPSLPGFDFGFADAITAFAASRSPLYTFRQAIIRNNVIGKLPSSVSGNFYAITFDGAENALIEANTVDLPGGSPIYHAGSKSVHYSNNATASGVPIQGRIGFNGPKVDELFTQIEDAFVLCL